MRALDYTVLRPIKTIALLMIILGFSISAPSGAAEDLTIGIDDITFRIPDGWSFAKQANYHRIYSVPKHEQAAIDADVLKQIVYISVFAGRQADHAAALLGLQQIASGSGSSTTFLPIAGWAAVQQQRLALRPQPGSETPGQGEQVLIITTGIVVADVLVQLEAWLPPDASSEQIAAVLAISASLTTSAVADPVIINQELEQLKSEPLKRLPILNPDVISVDNGPEVDVSDAVELAAAAPAAGSTVRVTNQGGVDSELEVAVANGGQNIVIGANSGFFFSNDGGSIWNNSAGVGSNDPSITWGQSGGPTGTFYAANIATPSTGFWTSTDGGANFTGPTPAYTCGQGGDPACGTTFPDQEHIVADRFNVAAGGDQVYSAWRHLDGTWGIVCSSDGGTTWSTNGFFTPGDLPKISVGQDGFVYVVYQTDNDDDIRLAKFTSCENNQNPMVAVSPPNIGWSVVVNSPSVACPVPGVDRCNLRNSLASPTVAVDDLNPNHIYVAYAVNTNPGGAVAGPVTPWWPTCTNQNLCNETIIVQDSLDGGATWSPGSASRTIAISSGITARRFMPWACTAGGEVFVSWYDRRAASPGGTSVSNNSLTDFYRGSAFLNVAGDLAPGTEMQVNETGSTDAQCEAGAVTGNVNSWPSVVDAQGDSESCSIQPQLGGRCCAPVDIDGSGRCPGSLAAGITISSGIRCDFDQTVCPAGETCAPNRGGPKYGDYNGNACAEGRLYVAWASATSPPVITPASTDIDTYFASDLVCCVPEVTVPNGVNFNEVCDDGTEHTATLEVCNTGAENLQVGSIDSSNTKFAVTEPLGGFSVDISPDFCFSFQVTMDASMGSQAGTLTVNTNDPMNPALEVPVSGGVGAPDINVAIASAGDFGKTCQTEHTDLDLTLFNQGKCDLTISNIELVADAGPFELPDDLNLPLVLSPDADFTLPVRFAPDACFDTPVMRMVKVTSDDPDEMMVNVDISGVSPCPNLVIDPLGLTGLFAFPATVVDTGGTLGCFSESNLDLRNSGECPLTITAISTGSADYIVTSPSSFPVLLPPGEETLAVAVRFTPQGDANPLAPSDVVGQLTVTSNDPDGDGLADLCGESVAQSGVRILVTDQSGPEPVPVGNVDTITVTSKGKNTPSPVSLRFTDQPLSSTMVCGNDVRYHVQQETLPATDTTGSNPRSSYIAKAKEGNLQAAEQFGLGQCEFRDFQLQLEDSDAVACLLLPKGDACSSNGECCSGKCRGKTGAKVCK